MSRLLYSARLKPVVTTFVALLDDVCWKFPVFRLLDLDMNCAYFSPPVNPFTLIDEGLVRHFPYGMGLMYSTQ